MSLRCEYKYLKLGLSLSCSGLTTAQFSELRINYVAGFLLTGSNEGFDPRKNITSALYIPGTL